MLSLFKREPVARPETTFKSRVQRFWEWYTTVAPQYSQTINSGNCPSLAGEVSAKVNELGPGFAWVFGPGANGEGHSFTLSGEGNLHRQLLPIYWLSQAPSLAGWTFYAAREPGSIKGIHIEIGGRKFDPLEFWVTVGVNQDKQKADITVWHPLFDRLPEQERWRVLFLFLDEVLGEYGTEQWIGEVKLDPKRLRDSIPLEELGEAIKKIESQYDWKKLPPGEQVVGYRSREQHDRFLRGDVVTGTTTHPLLLNEYLKADGEMEDALKGTGADYVFVAFDAQTLPAGNEAAARGEIEDALDQALKKSASGRLLGGAWGTVNAYIDLLLFDGQESNKIVRSVFVDRALPGGSSINYFAKEKRGHKMVL
jgi:hypothetical protein